MVIESPTITDDIIITSLPKTMAKIHFKITILTRVFNNEQLYIYIYIIYIEI